MEFNKYQKEAINTIDGNVCVIATAGSGKTSVLVERINHMVEDYNIDPSEILAVSFSKKACENMSERLSKRNSILSAVTVKTFHSLAYSILNECNGKFVVWTKPWEKEQMLFEICKSFGLCKNIDDLATAQILNFINTQKINMISPTDKKFVLTDGIPYALADMKMIYREYENQKKQKGYYEFEDLVNIACDHFKQNEKLCGRWSNKYKYLMVDEYQDISLNQNCLLHYLNDNNLFAVGDSLQAIYSFRGGDCKYLLNFDTEWDNAKIINLPINYRCSSDIVKTANQLALYTPDCTNKYYKPAIADKGKFVTPIFCEFDDIFQECKYIVETIKEKVQSNNYQYKDFAILARTNAQLQKIQFALSSSDIEFDIVDGSSFFELPEIKLIVSYLKLSKNTNDNYAFEYCYNKPNRWLSKAFLEEVKGISGKGSLYKAMFCIDRRNWRFKNGIDELYRVINHLQHKQYSTADKYINYIRTELNIDNFVLKGIDCNSEAITEKIDDLNTFEEMAKDYKSIDDLLEYIQNGSKVNKPTNSNCVKIMTLHKSKGLEFPVVFISGCSDGLLPHIKNKNKDDEKRLFYVGITRAEKELYLLHSDNYNSKTYDVSPFISYIKNTIESKSIGENTTTEKIK